MATEQGCTHCGSTTSTINGDVNSHGFGMCVEEADCETRAQNKARPKPEPICASTQKPHHWVMGVEPFTYVCDDCGAPMPKKELRPGEPVDHLLFILENATPVGNLHLRISEELKKWKLSPTTPIAFRVIPPNTGIFVMAVSPHKGENDRKVELLIDGDSFTTEGHTQESARVLAKKLRRCLAPHKTGCDVSVVVWRPRKR